MQNLKSLANLHQQPVMGANDNIQAIAGKEKIMLYDHAAQHRDFVRKIKEGQRSLLSHQLLEMSQQD